MPSTQDGGGAMPQEQVTTMPIRSKKKPDMHADHVGTIRVPRGHWDAFVIHCHREGITHKQAFTQMIEGFVHRRYLDFAYDKTNVDHVPDVN